MLFDKIIRLIRTKCHYFFLFFSLLYGCQIKSAEVTDTEEVVDSVNQVDLFSQLKSLTGNVIPEPRFQDSLAFLIVPLRESCPSCLDKTIDSILKYQYTLKENCIIIISANAGRKTMNGYFKERKGQLPEIPGQLFLDSLNKASSYNLFNSNPAIFYTESGKVYKRVAALPATVKQDLHDFFTMGK